MAVLEDFESANLGAYSGDTGDFSQSTSIFKHGSKSLHGDAGGGWVRIYRTDITTSQNNIYRWWIRSNDASTNRWYFLYHLQSGGSAYYGAGLYFGYLEIDYYNGGWSNLVYTPVSVSDNTWYELVLELDGSGNHTLSLYDSGGSFIDSVNVNNSSQTSGGIGWGYDNPDNYWDWLQRDEATTTAAPPPTTTEAPPPSTTTTEAPPPPPTTTPAPPPPTTTTLPPASTTTGACSGDVNIYVNGVLNTDLQLRSLTKSYVKPWEALMDYFGRHDAAGLPKLNDEILIRDAVSGQIFFRGGITERAPGGVAREGLLFIAKGRRFRLENEPVRINGRGQYLWNRRGMHCDWQMGEDSPGGDGGPWEAGEIVVDILEHALGLPAGGSDIPIHHGDSCCVTHTYLTADDIACYDATDPEDAGEPWRTGLLQLDSIIGEFSVNNTPVAFAIDLLLALNGGFYGWYIDPESQCLIIVNMDLCPEIDVAAGELGHWQDEGGKDYVLLDNRLEWSLDGVCSTIVIQGTDEITEEMPYNLEDTANAAKGDGGELDFVNAPWLGFPAAFHAKCQTKRRPAFKPIDLINPWAWPPDYTPDGYTPPIAPPGDPLIIGWAEAGPRIYKGTEHSGKYVWMPTPGVRMPIWSRVTGMIGFFEAPVLGTQWMGPIHGWEDEKLWAWYWASVPFLVSAGPEGDAYWWYGYERTRYVYDPVFKPVHGWPVCGTEDDEMAMRILARRLLRIYRDVRRQGELSVDVADLCLYDLPQRFNVTNLTASGDAPDLPVSTTTTPIPGNPVEWSTLKINSVEIVYDFARNRTVIRVANTFWMLEEYSELKRRLEMNLFKERELALSEDINECQVLPPNDGGEVEVTTTPGPPPTTEAPTTPAPGPSTTTVPPPTTTTPFECDPPLPDILYLRICDVFHLCGDFKACEEWLHPDGATWCMKLTRSATEPALWLSNGGFWRLNWDPVTAHWWVACYVRANCWLRDRRNGALGDRCEPLGWYSYQLCDDDGCDCEDCHTGAGTCCNSAAMDQAIEVIESCESCLPTTTTGAPTTTTTPGSTTTVTGTTTTGAPTTTLPPGSTTTPSGEEGCPEDSWCEDHCADPYYVTLNTGLCDSITDCSGSYVLDWSAACVWTEGFGPNGCTGELRCLSGVAYPHSWQLDITHGGDQCWYERAVTTFSCPDGIYSLENGTCADCDDTVEITTTP